MQSKIVTTSFSTKDYTIKVTQRLIDKNFSIGHYNGFIKNNIGHIVDTFSSTGAPKNKLKMTDIVIMLQKFIKENKEEIETETTETNVIGSIEVLQIT